ncbi:DUF1015 family protein, partial [Sporomusa sp. KB1]|uniref:DUF1015 family protein n=1 Tax=Sporomusa sp. KB1 TaxID=943346 RepID=UPI002104E890
MENTLIYIQNYGILMREEEELMAVVKPFCGLRPVPELAEKVASLPYDVMDSQEARAITEKNPYSFLRVTKSEVDLEPEGNKVTVPLYPFKKVDLQGHGSPPPC